MHPSRRQSVDGEFERETKLVVLNFMGLVPASCPATAEVCDSVRVDVGYDTEEDEVPQRSHSALPGGNCDLQPVPELPGEESCSMVNRGIQNGTLDSQYYNEQLDNEGTDAAEIVVSTRSQDGDGSVNETASKEKLNLESHLQSASVALSDQHILRPPRNSGHQTQSGLLQTPVIAARSRTPSPCGAATPALLERQSSSRSTTSSRSRSSGTRNSSINVQLADLETLIRTHALPPLVIPLRDEITHEMEALGQEHHNADAAQGVFYFSFYGPLFAQETQLSQRDRTARWMLRGNVRCSS